MTQGAETVAQSRARILMVDDRPENLMALEAIMEPLGHDMVRANSGEEALRQVLLHDFAVILLDVQMPGMNGFETAQLIKSRERSRSTPIIFLTAISKDEQYVFTGYSVGAVDYLSKPFNPDVLRSKVAVFIDLYLKTEQLKDQEKRLRESEVRELELAHRARLLESEARMAEIVGSALEAILTFDDERRITLFNSAAERTFGRPASDAMGLPFDDLLSPAFRGVALEEMCAAAAARAASVLEGKSPDGDDGLHEHALEGMRAGGEVFPLEGSISCLQLDSERVYTVIARDVTERKRAEEALRQQAAELKSLNGQLQARQRELENAMASRSRFYASMSHELRTPINAILGYSSLLLDSIYGPLNPEQARGIERAHAAAKHLLELVNDILDLSKIEAGKVDIEVQPAAFPSLVQDLFVTVRPLADEHGSELTLESGGDAVITTDARRVRQILLNLLSNAIKFGDGKPITVRCQKREDGGMDVDVMDRGRGIEPQDLERIFDEFVQLADPDQQVGTGLGLPISRRLTVLLGGTLTVESTVGDGSTFRLCLPPKLDMRLISGEGLPLPTATTDPVQPASPAAIGAAGGEPGEPVDAGDSVDAGESVDGGGTADDGETPDAGASADNREPAGDGVPTDDGAPADEGDDDELPADADEPSPARLAS